MAERIISEETINAFREYLVLEEKKHGHRGEISPGCPCFSLVMDSQFLFHILRREVPLLPPERRPFSSSVISFCIAISFSYWRYSSISRTAYRSCGKTNAAP